MKESHSLMFDYVVLCVTLLLSLFNENGSLNVPLAVAVLTLSGASVWRVRKNAYLLIIYASILYCNYSICMVNYISVLRGTMFTSFAGTEVANIGLKILVFFTAELYLIAVYCGRMQRGKVRVNVISDNRYNALIILFLLIVCWIIWIFGFGRPEKVGQRGSPSTYFEYAIILIIFGFYYSGKNRYAKFAFAITAFSYAMLNFMYGGRATGLQMLIALLLCTVYDRIPKTWIAMGGLLAYFLMMYIGIFRAKWTFHEGNLLTAWNAITARSFSSDTAFSSYFTSLTMIIFRNVCTEKQRLYYFSRYLLSILFGGRVKDSGLAALTRTVVFHWNGGIVPYFFWFYLGAFGLLVIGAYIGFIFTNLLRRTQENSGLWRCIGIYVSSSALRWYLYSPSQITRGVLILTVCYYILLAVDMLAKKQLVIRLF